jgi:hypothetical protein
MRVTYLITAAIAAVFSSASIGGAQSPTKTFGNWKVECKVDKMSDRRSIPIRSGHHEDRTPTHGYAPTREAAMTAFAKSWRRG